MEKVNEGEERHCRCQPCWCCYFKSCLQLRAATMIVGGFEVMWNVVGIAITTWIILFFEKTSEKAIQGGYATNQDYKYESFMEVNGDGLRMLCASYLIAAIVSFGLVLHADKRKKLFTVWWLLVMPNVTGLQIAAIYFFPFPFTHANSAMVVIRLYFFWTVYSYARELFKYPDGLPKPAAPAQAEVNEEGAEAGDKPNGGSSFDSENHMGSVDSHQEGDNVVAISESQKQHHHETQVSPDYIDSPSLAEHHHKHNDAQQHGPHYSQQHHLQNPYSKSVGVSSKNYEQYNPAYQYSPYRYDYNNYGHYK